MIAVQRPETFFVSSPPHQRRHVLRTRPFHPRPRLRPRPATLPEQTNTRRPPPPAFAPRAVLQALKSLRPKLARPRPAWALPAPQTQAQQEASEPHEDDESENEAEVEALLAFAEGLMVDGLEDDMEVVANSSSSPLASLPSPPVTPSPHAPSRPSPAAAGRMSEQIAPRSETLRPPSPTILEASTGIPSPPPPPSPAAPSAGAPPHVSVGPIHSARSVVALMERRALAVITAATDGHGQVRKGEKGPLIPLRRRRGGGNGGVTAEEDEAVPAALATEGEGGGGGRPLDMPRVVVIDEEGGMRRQRRLGQLPYSHENPAL